MTPLIDADILRYECGNMAEYIDEVTGEKVVRDFSFAAEKLDEKIKEICTLVWATEEPILFLTNDRRLHKTVNKKLAKQGLPQMEYMPNFRDEVAEKKEYKGNRLNTDGTPKNKKPFHYDNLTAYMFANYNVQVAVGMEADDLMSAHQYARLDKLDTIICSRDKDLRITPGMHFGWECGRQAQWGPKRVTELGDIELSRDRSSVKGTGLKFFYSQVLTGDVVDNIPGLPRCGAVTCHKSLHDATTEAELFERVFGLYEAKYGESAWKEMNEQAQLLWMCRELNEDGSPVKFVMFNKRGG